MSGHLDEFQEWGIDAGVEVELGASAPAADTPAAWFAGKFPALPTRYGDAVEEAFPEDDRPYVRDVSEDFIAATLSVDGAPDAPTVFAAWEERFFRYSPVSGVYEEVRDAKLGADLADLLLDCARACQQKFDTRKLAFKFRDSANVRGILARARGILEVHHGFFETNLTEFVPCKNGMLRLSDRAILPFGPEYRRRNKLAVPYEPSATCPMFIEKLLQPALDEADIDLLQRWCGLALVGVNLSQRLVILSGTAGGGKGTFIRVLQGIIGSGNVGSMRPELLAERFELGRLLGKSLLYGPDVAENFLNCKGASVIKALTGGDPVTLEFKGSNERPEIVCRFNAIVTCNSRLTVHLEGDADAWRRRLVIIEYSRPKPKAEDVVTDLSERILATEASGVLNWMLEGLEKLRSANWLIHLTSEQQKRVDDLLLESEADVVFAKECLQKDGLETLTVSACYEAYVQFCNDRGWAAIARRKFSTSIVDTVTRLFGLTVRHDIYQPDEKPQRGWKGLKCV